MTGAAQAGLFVVSTIGTLYLCVILVRILLRWHRADFHNPLAQFVWQATNPLVTPLMNVIPRWRQLDTAAVLVLFVLTALFIALISAIIGASIPIPQILYFALLKIILMLLHVHIFCVFVLAIMSWFAPQGYNPMTAPLWSIAEPILAPVRRNIPAIGGLDLSPMLVIIALYALALMVPLAPVFR